MTSDVVLSSAMRSNLLSLQGTQSQIDITQNRLSTGKKVNSALDGPQAFFASQALTNRASDLNRLLDSIGQSIQVIKAADNGVTALSKLVEQADSIANSARDALAQGTAEAKAAGTADLRNIADIRTINGMTAAGGDTLTFRLTQEDGSAYDLDTATLGIQDTFTVATAGVEMSTEMLMTQINDQRDSDGNRVMEASLNDKGQLELRTLRGGSFSLTFDSAGGTPADDLAMAQALGFGDVAKLTDDGAAGSTVSFTALSDVSLVSYKMDRNATGDIAQRSTLLSALTNSEDGSALFAGLDDAADDYTISINGGTSQAINLTDTATGASLTVQDFIDQINNNTALNTKIKASFDETTGQISLTPIDATVKSVQIGVVGDAGGVTANFGFGTTSLVAAGADPIAENIQVGKAAAQLASYEKEFNNIREQITQLVSNGDTGYRGTNLLNGDDLLTVFNENRTSNLTTEGVSFTADGLGISEANFARADTVDAALTEVREALNTVRDFGSTLANDLSIIQARQTFTTELVNTLKEGSAKLVDADQNEEGAKLLALQTRQSLGVTALSLASQSQQSILRLF